MQRIPEEERNCVSDGYGILGNPEVSWWGH